MRLMFYRPASATFSSEVPLPFQVSLPVSSASNAESFGESFKLVGNPGNMVHRMAIVQTLKFDRRNSSALNVIRMLKKSGLEKTTEAINSNYDAAIITFSNIVNPDADEPGLADIVERLDIPIYAFGVGIQVDFPADLTQLKPSVASLFSVLERKAKLLAVRGETTKSWLNRAGLSTPVALGCPSMFVYPRNVFSLRPPSKAERVMSAGHMGAANLKPNGNGRGRSLIAGFMGHGAAPIELSYVFQGEVRNYPSFKSNPFIYNEATSTLDFETVCADMQDLYGQRHPFTRFYSFNDVGAWRQASMRYDVFIGDRIHGAVAAMQAGVPALVLYDDARVKELTSYHGIPNCSVEEFAKIGYLAAIDKYLTSEAFARFRNRYVLVMKKFAETVGQAGLELANAGEIKSVLQQHRKSRGVETTS